MEENTYKYILDELGKQNKINETFNNSIDAIANAHNELVNRTYKMNNEIIKVLKKNNTLDCLAIASLAIVCISQARKIKSLELKVDALDTKLSHAKLDYGTFYNQDKNEVKE